MSSSIDVLNYIKNDSIISLLCLSIKIRQVHQKEKHRQIEKKEIYDKEEDKKYIEEK